MIACKGANVTSGDGLHSHHKFGLVDCVITIQGNRVELVNPENFPISPPSSAFPTTILMALILHFTIWIIN